MADELLLEPQQAYKKLYKNKHHENTVKYFDELVKKAGINIEENKKTVDKYKNINEEIKKLKKKRGWLKFWRVMCCIIFILIFIVFIWLNKKIKALTDQINNMEGEAEKLLNLAWSQMSALNNLYDWNIPSTICNMDSDLIHFDKYFDAEKFQYLYDAFGLDENDEKNVSTVMVQSGEIYGNPFLMCRDYRQDWYQKTYTGSITIHWTSVVHDKNGTRTVHHTQTLTASVQKPAPSYGYVTYLVYGNDAAPKLSFSRGPSNASGKDEKAINKMVKKEAKQLDKKAKHDLMDNDPTTNYTRLGNDEFESLFGGENRDNEVEFRLLFTPLAQKNLINLIKDPEPYGDDFYFTKKKKLNYIQSRHSQSMNYNPSPNFFYNYDYEAARKHFIEYNDLYFQAFFYDLCPIISIPIYQQQKSLKYIYKDNYRSNMVSYEHEVLANSFDRGLFKHANSKTDAILKTSFDHSNGKIDSVKVTAHSFDIARRTEYITQMGGDGRLHTIPVHWDEYLPLEKETDMATVVSGKSKNAFKALIEGPQLKGLISGLNGNYVFQRGLFAFILNRAMNPNEASNIESSVVENNSNINTNILNNSASEVKEAVKEAEKSVDMNVSNEDLANQD